MNKHESILSSLPADFIFGVATAAYQIEGATDTDGRGTSIWDDFSRTPGNVVNNDTGDRACEHYRLWSNDLDMIKSLHADAYRFSIAWPRVMPHGTGSINVKGLAFYDQLIDGCLERGLQTVATLYHWDLPSTLQQAGGWTNRNTALAFAEYAELIAMRFGDRLSSLTTFNEPWCSSVLGHLNGIHAPGHKSIVETIQAIHHQHLAHGLAVSAVKASAPALPVGIVLNLQSIYPCDDTEKNREAARRHSVFHNGSFLDPLFKGHYPQEFVAALGEHLPDKWQDDLNTIQQRLDFWGLNYYAPSRVLHQSEAITPFPHSTTVLVDATVPHTDIGWEIDASTFETLLRQVYRDYQLPPCYITENGACFNDEPTNGVIQDDRRIAYLNEHIQAAANACAAGVPIKGYFAWSLMDNFEWAEGYAMRFGLIHVNYDTQQRTVKQSGNWFAELVKAQQCRRNSSRL